MSAALEVVLSSGNPVELEVDGRPVVVVPVPPALVEEAAPVEDVRTPPPEELLPPAHGGVEPSELVGVDSSESPQPASPASKTSADRERIC